MGVSYRGYTGVIYALYRDNGKEHGSYYRVLGLYWGYYYRVYIGIYGSFPRLVVPFSGVAIIRIVAC